MTDEEFEIFVFEIIPQQLFHVESTDIDYETGASLEEVILVRLIAAHPGCLKHKSLKWFTTTRSLEHTKNNKKRIKFA